MHALRWNPGTAPRGKQPSAARRFHDQQPLGERKKLSAGMTVGRRPVGLGPREFERQHRNVAFGEAAECGRIERILSQNLIIVTLLRYRAPLLR